MVDADAWTPRTLVAAALGAGVIPGAVYAMLVTAHATSILVPGDEAGHA